MSFHRRRDHIRLFSCFVGRVAQRKLLHKFLREVLRFRHSLVVVVAVVDGNYGTAFTAYNLMTVSPIDFRSLYMWISYRK